MPFLAVCLLAMCNLAITERLGNKTDRHLSKRFVPVIYPKNSVIQFALGLALPAEVRGRNVATNSGILININLPTNLSELRPPARSLRSSPQHVGIIRQISDMLLIKKGEKRSCLTRSICMLYNIRHHGTIFAHDVFRAVLDAVFEDDDELGFADYRENIFRMSRQDCYNTNKGKCDSLLIKILEEIFQM